MSRSVMRKNWVPICKVKVTNNQHMTFYCVFWTDIYTFATSLIFVVDHDKPKCPVKVLDCCIQGQDPSKVQIFYYYFFRWYFLHHQTFCNQTWFGDAAASALGLCEKIICKVKITLRAHIYNWSIWLWLFLLVLHLLNCWSFCNQTLMMHQKLECLVKWFSCCVQGHSYSQSSELHWMFVFGWYLVNS